MADSKSVIRETGEEVVDLTRRIRKRDFSGNVGTAIKNSSFFIGKTLVEKFGSLLFVIILARVLMPELYGLYGLALSTILFLSAFSELGISSALAMYLSKHIDNSKAKAKGYLVFLTKIKLVFVLLGGLFIVLTAHYFANVYYDKPIFYALIAGGLYYPMVHMSRYLGIIFVSKNNFRVDFIAEFVFQGLRILLVPLLVLYLLPRVGDPNVLLLYLFLSLTFCFFITGVYYVIAYLRAGIFDGVKASSLTKKEKREILYFVMPLTLTSFSGIFFGYVDTIMLGHFVASEFIGYYQAAFNLISAASVIIAFTGVSLFPVFSRLKGEQLKRGFRKTRNLTALLSLFALVITAVVAPYVIWLVYGPEYSPAASLLRLFSVLLISFPLTSLYQTYYTSQGKTKEFSLLLFASTILNVVLNYMFIKQGLAYGMQEAVMGACVATIISRYAYLFSLGVYKKRIEMTI